MTMAACAQPPYNNIDNEQLKSMIEQGVPVYDIRRPDEWKQTGVVKGSRLMTFFDANGNVYADFLPKFSEQIKKDQPVILICRTGNRTGMLAKYLVEKLGYTQVYNVKHGITDWIRKGKPVSKI
ncbi:MAG: rhodanese-like domain-containing protein [Gammaproteobacteria bacterium]|nr:rhodanese-like domain-containing protein [Gammaproteobacteria bacterium]